MLLGGQLHGCIRRPSRCSRIPAEPSLRARATEYLDIEARQALAKIGAYRCPPIDPPATIESAPAPVQNFVTQFKSMCESAAPSGVKLPEGISLPEGVSTPEWLTQGSKGLGDAVKQLQTQLTAVREGAAGSTAKLQESLIELRDKLAGAAAVPEAQWKETVTRLTNALPAGGSDTHFGSAAIQEFLDNLKASAPTFETPKQQLEEIQAANQATRAELEANLQKLVDQPAQLSNTLAEQVKETESSVQDLLASGPEGILTALQNLWVDLQGRQGFAGHSWATIAAVSFLVAALIIYSIPSKERVGEPEPLPRLEYDIEEIGDYWVQRPVAVARRASVVASEGLRWGLRWGLDKVRGKVREGQAKRAAELRGVLERLGPAYVKIAQAVSTRVDLLAPEYLTEIELLQDRVPPFPNEIAEQTMQRAFGVPSRAIFSSLSGQPVAAASLGQVYRGRLQPQYGGGEIAVKVQRPGVLLSVALDLFLMRWVAEKVDGIYKTKWTGIIDEWAGRFFHELDYSREAHNALVFKEQMAQLKGITVPEVYQQLCSQEVLTTAWVEGEKLGESNAADVRELCSTLLNCYLIQLLDTGLLHADPHPGNLLRTPDGKICILDFGLMTEISSDRSIALVEYIAHLTTEDYEKIPGDLYKLGFIPEGAPDPVSSGLVEPLSRILKQLSKGGGAKEINIDEITVEMEDLTRKYPFQIPSYFALILRAFSVIEGIALRSDPTYAIVPECFPYMSRRLLTDNSPRVRAALQQMLYGNKKRLDVERLKRLAGGFGNFTTTGLTSQTPQTDAVDKPILDPVSVEALRTLFSQDGSYIQEVFVEESAAAVDAIGRETASQVSRGVLGSVPALASRSFVQSLGPLRPVLLPGPTPLELLSRFAPRVQPTLEDQEALNNARSLVSLLGQPGSGLPINPSPAAFRQNLAQAQKLVREVQPLLPELLPGILLTGDLFVRALVRRVALRIAEEADRRPTPPAPAPRASYGNPPQPQDPSRWLGDAIAASPLWLLLPPIPAVRAMMENRQK